MLLRKNFIILCSLLLSFLVSEAQIEVVHASVKDFKAFGFGAFLNVSIPVSDANFLTIEGGLQYFKNRFDEDLGFVPVLLGYRYTLDQSGTGFYLEPNAGYAYGSSTIGVYENDSPVSDGNGGWAYEKVAGPMAGVGLGYLFEFTGTIQFNLGFRFEHAFGKAGTNLFAFRIAHAITIGRRDNY